MRFKMKSQNVSVKFGKVVAEWPKLEGAPDIHLADFIVLENGQEKLHIGEVGLQFEILPLLIGKVRPATISLRNPVIRIIRDLDGSYRLLVADTEEGPAETPDTPIVPLPQPTIQQIGNALFLGGDLPDQSLRMFKDLRNVNITSAKLIAEDRILKTVWALPKINIHLNRSEDSIDLSTSYQPPDRPNIASLNARITKLKDGGFGYSADIRDSDVARLARTFTDLAVLKGQNMLVNGIVEGELDPTWTLRSAIMAVRSPKGTIRLNPDRDDEFAYEDLSINLTYDKPNNRFSISNTNLRVNDTTFSISAEREVGADGKAVLPIRVSIPEITLMQIAALWPKEYHDAHAAEWLVQRLSKATLRNLAVTARIPEDDPGSISGKDIDGMFDFENLTTDYRAPLTPATQAKGRATLKNDVLDIEIDSGKIGDLTIKDRAGHDHGIDRRHQQGRDGNRTC